MDRFGFPAQDRLVVACGQNCNGDCLSLCLNSIFFYYLYLIYYNCCYDYCCCSCCCCCCLLLNYSEINANQTEIKQINHTIAKWSNVKDEMKTNNQTNNSKMSKIKNHFNSRLLRFRKVSLNKFCTVITMSVQLSLIAVPLHVFGSDGQTTLNYHFFFFHTGSPFFATMYGIRRQINTFQAEFGFLGRGGR